MKKLIMAAAALTAGFVVMADDSIVSSTVVGYQSYKLNDGYCMTTVMFAPTTGNKIPLQSITPVGAYGDGDVVIQTMDSEGNWAGEYSWLTKEGWQVAEDGWYDKNETKVDIDINYKQGMFVQSATEGVKLLYSGTVVTGTIETETPNGYSMTGNATPTILDIQSIVPVGENVYGDGDVVIQTMDSEGNWAGEYSWLTKEGWKVAEDGWYDKNEVKAKCNINPGEGLFIQTQADGVKLQYSSSL